MHKPGRFFIVEGGQEAYLIYEMTSGKIDIQHTLTPESLRGMGLAEALTRAAYEYAQKKGLKVIPTCSYVREYFLKKHPEFEKISGK